MKSLYLYFTLGYPTSRVLNSFLESIDGNAVTGIELGFPSRDPHYDGPVIRKTHAVALSGDPSGSDETVSLLSKMGVRKYSLTYYSDAGGNFSEFLSYLSSHGFTGAILPDILVDYFDEYRQIIRACTESGISVIPFFTASTPDRVIEEVSSLTDSWIYFGIQPSTGINVPFDLAEASARMRDIIGKRELIYGFGIRNTEQIREVIEAGGDGIAIGSLLVPYLENNDFAGFSAKIDELRGVLNDYS